MPINLYFCTSTMLIGTKETAFNLFCHLIWSFLSSTDQKDPKTGELEGLSFEFNLCEAVATWEQVSDSVRS